jgi:hypothetical protein
MAIAQAGKPHHIGGPDPLGIGPSIGPSSPAAPREQRRSACSRVGLHLYNAVRVVVHTVERSGAAPQRPAERQLLTCPV